MNAQLANEIRDRINDATDSKFQEVYPQHFIGDKTLIGFADKTITVKFPGRVSKLPMRGIIIINDFPLRTFEMHQVGDN